jgi:glycerol-3-phosphate acyltransferase PlsY
MIGSELLNYTISLLLGYLLGSFPTAYILVTQKDQIDIRQAGSGNIGARNAMEVSGSKLVGLIVLIVDVIKGSGAVILSSQLLDYNFWMMASGGIGAVIGHNYSIWMRFKGGRGLATTAGVMILLGWIYILIWLILYFIAQQFSKHIHLSSVVASILGPFVLFLIPEPILKSMLFFSHRASDVIIIGTIFSFMILLRHIESMKKLLFETKKYPNEIDTV